MIAVLFLTARKDSEKIFVSRISQSLQIPPARLAIKVDCGIYDQLLWINFASWTFMILSTMKKVRRSSVVRYDRFCWSGARVSCNMFAEASDSLRTPSRRIKVITMRVNQFDLTYRGMLFFSRKESLRGSLLLVRTCHIQIYAPQSFQMFEFCSNPLLHPLKLCLRLAKLQHASAPAKIFYTFFLASRPRSSPSLQNVFMRFKKRDLWFLYAAKFASIISYRTGKVRTTFIFRKKYQSKLLPRGM